MKGSFTVELSVLFPVVLLVLVLFMQFGLYFMYRIYTLNALNQSLIICNRARQEQRTEEEAVQLAENYLNNLLEQIPVEIEEVQCKMEANLFEEEYTIWVTARYSFVSELSWTVIGKTCVMNPVGFRNRVDFIWEKGKQYMDQIKEER